MHPLRKFQLMIAFLALFASSCVRADPLSITSSIPFTTLSTVIPAVRTATQAAAQGILPTGVIPGENKSKQIPADRNVSSRATITPAPTKVEEYSFQSGRFKLVGDLQLPKGTGPFPVVIMVHGDGPIDRYDYGKYLPLMERFLGAGYAVFSYDKPGTGESSGEFSHGSDLLAERAAILLEAVELLKRNPAIDPGWIGFWGISQAGYVMPLTLKASDDIAFMIVTGGPAEDSLNQMVYLIGQQFVCRGYTKKVAQAVQENFALLYSANIYTEYRTAKEFLINYPYAMNFTALEITPEEQWFPEEYGPLFYFNPIEVIQGTTIPVLAFFGEKDTQVNPYQGVAAYQEALEKAGNKNHRVELIPDADHNIVLSHSGCMEERNNRSKEEWLHYAPEYLDIMEEWLGELYESLDHK